jgi:ABC-2 type transport system ATP-binding protein
MRQRLGLAAAMLGDPAVVVLDEPANGLDPAGISWVRGLLRGWADEGRTVLVSSHLLAEVAQAVDRVVIIRDGSLVIETGIATLSADRVTVRVDRPDALIGALMGDGADFEIVLDGSLAVTGLDAGEIAILAARVGAVITELTRSSPSATLEAMFLSATAGPAR